MAEETKNNETKADQPQASEEITTNAPGESDRELLEANQLAETYKDQLLRKAAEFENYKRRTENDQFSLINYAAESFIIKLLPIVDDFERSMDHIDDIENNKSVKDGIELVYEKLQKLLNEQDVKKMQTKGEPFNVDYHDALMQRKDNSVPPHTVLEEVDSSTENEK